MPIYEYRCDACGHHLEALQKISDEPLKQCPQCNQLSLVKKVSAAAFRLSGSGWYETDFKSKNKKNLAGDAGKPDTQKKSSETTSKQKTANKQPTQTSSSSAKAD